MEGERDALVVDVPAGNYWAKTGMLTRERLVVLDERPVRLTARFDPARLRAGMAMRLVIVPLHVDDRLLVSFVLNRSRRDFGGQILPPRLENRCSLLSGGRRKSV